MALSSDLISQLVKVTKEPKKASESTSYGTTVKYEGRTYVKLDGSDLLTPVSTTSSVKDGDRVTVLIKDHSATITGNTSDPSASSDTVKHQGDQISEFEIVIAYKVKTDDLEAINAYIENLRVELAKIDKLEAVKADIDELEARLINVDHLTATDMEAINAQIESLEATFGSFTDISTEDLEVINAEIGRLKAYTAEFTYVSAEVLEAVKADIKTLNVEKLSAVEADIKYATITELNAAKADIDKLDANVADIDTLIFGSASGDTIQASFANAVIAQLGNAQIKSAMIESIAADKITAGDIITNNVRVMSEDGKLLISDETIQISDDTRVRVQIGKDASDDYSINIWDADGNLMFSEGGLTDKAIKEAIIRNDMVSENANIAASKLDISSLFTEINGSTETINSSKILMDADNQTLDVAFTQMSSDVDGLSNDVSTQGTAISVIQGQISSKIWQQDIDKAIDGFTPDTEGLDELTTKYSELKQDVDSISATVASHTTQISNKADNSTVTAVSDRVSKVETDLEGFRTTVSETYVTQTELKATDDKAVAAQNEVNGLETRMDTAETDISTAQKAANDAQADVDALATRVTTAETSIEQNTEKIALMATKSEITETLKGYYTIEEADAAIELSANEVKTTVSNTYATKTALATTDTKATNAATAAANAQSTANSANTAASNAQTAADNAQDDIDALAIRVSTAETSIEQNADAIALRATKTELNAVSTTAQNAKSAADTAKTNADTALSTAGEAKTTANTVQTDLANNYYTKTETEAQITLESDSIKSTVSETYATKTALNELEVGGRNLLINSSFESNFDNWGNSGAEIVTIDDVSCAHITGALESTKTVSQSIIDKIDVNDLEQPYVFSADIRLDNYVAGETNPYVQLYFSGNYDNNGTSSWIGATTVSGSPACHSHSGEGWARVVWVVQFAHVPTAMSAYIYARDFTGDLYFKDLKLEKGNKATDWTPAPEDVDADISEVSEAAIAAQETADKNADRVNVAESTITQLADSIAMLITDENGSSLMTQTENGWSFDISNITNGLNSATTNIQTLTEDLGGIDNTVNSLSQAVNDLGVLTDYVVITTYEGQPCIELGESENNFKLRITNTAIQFVEGSALPAYINNQKLMIEQAEVKNELQFGGFVWKTRSNGNMGILWKGVSS